MRAPGADLLTGVSPFPRIGEYGFLSDCEAMALVAPSGNIEWLCLPRVDSPSVFGALLDRHAGGFRLGPAEVTVPADRRYLPGTMVLETSWGTATGWVNIRDVLLIGPWHHESELSNTHKRAPTDYDADHVLLRTIRCVNGDVQIELDCEPKFDYGRRPAKWEFTERRYHEGLARPATDPTGHVPDEESPVELRLTTDLRIGFEGGRATARTLLHEGDTRFCALSWSEHKPPYTYEEAYSRLTWTAHHWQHWLARGRFPDHPWRTHLERSALTLKGLTFAPTGAVVAAATTSLPEDPRGERNWDYRYTWIRDSAFTLWGLHTLGFDWEATDFFWFLADVAERDEVLQIMYRVDGSPELSEQVLDHLGGYDGARPVRVGNDAARQHQNDVWGAVIDSVYIHTRSVDRLDDRIWPILCRQVQQAMDNWQAPDHGIWEVRGEPKHFISSKVMCWVAMDRGARLARLRGDSALEEEWSDVASEIKADVCKRGLSEDGVFRQHYGTDALDASLLLLPIVGFLPGDDDRIIKTVRTVDDELTEEGLVLRYRAKDTDDGLSGEEATFAICSFWLVSALAIIGDDSRAERLCERLLSFAGSLGLYAEQIDPLSGRHLGNVPQAFTHLALINAVMHVIGEQHKLPTRGILPVYF
jgi:alpha,alpha-trehalase